MARTNSYNNRLQPSEMKDVQSGQSTAAIDLLYYWNYTSPATSSTTNNGNLTNVQVNTQALGMLASNYYQTFAYDNVNRLTTAGDNGGYGWSQNFGYDQFGNMWLSSFAGIVTPNLTPSLQSKINAATNHVSLASGTAYDGNGNLTTYGSSTLTYDTNNMMIGVAGSATYAYDGLGQRVSKVYGGVTTAYVYDAFGNPAAEYSSAATSLPVCATCYLSWDHIGSTRLVTDQNATPVARHDFLPFGGEIIGAYASRPSLWGTTDYVDPKFTGQFRDTESGLDFFNSRYHAQAMGRLLSADPAQAGADAMNPQTWNGYAYTINSPLVFTDPDGMDPFDGGGDTGDPCIDDPFLCSSGGGGPGWPTQPIPPPQPPLPPIVSSSGVPNTSGVYGQGQFGIGGGVFGQGQIGPGVFSLAPTPAPTATPGSILESILGVALGPVVLAVELILLNPGSAGGNAEVEFENANKRRWQRSQYKISPGLGPKRPPITDEVRRECEQYAHARSDKNGNPRYDTQWVKDYRACLEAGGIENMGF